MCGVAHHTRYIDEEAGVRQFDVYKKTCRYKMPVAKVLVMSKLLGLSLLLLLHSPR